MVEIAGLIIGAFAVRLASARPPLLRAAVLAQAADLATFGFAWQWGYGERNPLGRLAADSMRGLFPPNFTYEAVFTAALILMLAKLALIWYLIRMAPHLNRYRRAVLAVATAVGIVGAASNVVAFPIFH